MRMTTRVVGAMCALAMATAGAPAQSDGPDVILEDIHQITGFSFGATRAYSIGSTTCNIGDAILPWGDAADGSPALAMNLYELSDGRLRQIAMSWCKTSDFAISSGSCGFPCGPAVLGEQLGAGCRDVYSAFFNAGQNNMAPRSSINAFTGAMSGPVSGASGSIARRMQAPASDLPSDGVYFVEGVFVSTADAMNGNTDNNASYRRISISDAFQATLEDSTQSTVPAIDAWRQYGAGLDGAGGGIPDESVQILNVDVPDEGRFVVGSNVVDNGDGSWTYNYAVFNLNSDRSAGGLRVPIGAGADVTDVMSHAPEWHSGEVYDNTPWAPSLDGGSVAWSTVEPFATNDLGNAIRWGTMHTFWFNANTPPEPGMLELTLFTPGTPGTVTWNAPVPSAGSGCACEFGGDPDDVSVEDLLAYLALWFAQDAGAEVTGDAPADVDVQDLLVFLACWFPASAGSCP